MVVSVAVCEIFSVKEWCDLENGLGFVQGQWKWHHLIDRIRVPIHLPWRYFVSFARYSDLLVENREFFLPHLYLVPRGGDPVGISWKCLMLLKLEWFGYRMVKNLWRYVKPFSSDNGTLRTDGRTDRQICYINIAHQHTALLTRDENVKIRVTLSWVTLQWNFTELLKSKTKWSAAGEWGQCHLSESCTILELFDVEYNHDLEIWLRGHSRSLKLVPFESYRAASYLPSIVTMTISVEWPK